MVQDKATASVVVQDEARAGGVVVQDEVVHGKVGVSAGNRLAERSRATFEAGLVVSGVKTGWRAAQRYTGFEDSQVVAQRDAADSVDASHQHTH